MGLEQLVKREQKFLKHHAGGSVASKKFREWLSDMGTTQADAAKKMGISEEMLSRYLNGEHLPGLVKAKAITDLTLGKVEAYDWLTES